MTTPSEPWFTMADDLARQRDEMAGKVEEMTDYLTDPDAGLENPHLDRLRDALAVEDYKERRQMLLAMIEEFFKAYAKFRRKMEQAGKAAKGGDGMSMWFGRSKVWFEWSLGLPRLFGLLEDLHLLELGEASARAVAEEIKEKEP